MTLKDVAVEVGGCIGIVMGFLLGIWLIVFAVIASNEPSEFAQVEACRAGTSYLKREVVNQAIMTRQEYRKQWWSKHLFSARWDNTPLIDGRAKP